MNKILNLRKNVQKYGKQQRIFWTLKQKKENLFQKKIVILMKR